MKHFIENIIHKLGKKDYKLDKNLTSKGLIILPAFSLSSKDSPTLPHCLSSYNAHL